MIWPAPIVMEEGAAPVPAAPLPAAKPMGPCAVCGSDDWGPRQHYRHPCESWTMHDGQPIPVHEGQCREAFLGGLVRRQTPGPVVRLPRVSSSAKPFRDYKQR